MSAEIPLRRVLTLDHAVLPLVARMQTNGVPIDRPACLALAASLQTRYEAILHELHACLGYYVNPNSDKQVRGVIKSLLPAEDVAQLKLTDSKTDISTGKKVIEALRGIHPAIDLVIEGRKVTKMRSTYALPLGLEQDPPPPAEPHRARSELKVTRVASGRLAASQREDEDGDKDGVSLLTVPTRDEQYGLPIKRCIRCRDGRVLLEADYSQIEFRVVAHLAQDARMMQIFFDDEDLHIRTACSIFGLKPHELDKRKHRAPAKNAGFGILFGITAEGYRDQMRMMGVGDQWPLDRCQEILDLWFDVYPGVRHFIAQTRAEVAQRGYVSDSSGRRRYLPGAGSEKSWLREEAWRQAVSLKVQGGAQHIIKEAMADLWDAVLVPHWQWPGHHYQEPLLQVHDALLLETAAGEAIEAELLRQVEMVMVHAGRGLTVPVKVGMGTGPDWGSVEK